MAASQNHCILTKRLKSNRQTLLLSIEKRILESEKPLRNNIDALGLEINFHMPEKKNKKSI